jgi:predicted ATPase
LEICRRLPGVPLALELAAAQLDVFGAMDLDDRFAVLTRGRRTALPRHRTLRAAMDWSYDLLPEAEQTILRRLAVFQCDFTMDAASGTSAGTWSGKSTANWEGGARPVIYHARYATCWQPHVKG